MATITYLLGAGASANCLPVVNGMGEAILRLANEVYIDYRAVPSRTIFSDNTMLQLKADLEWLATACANHSSIDTYAKKLYISKQDRDYNRLKDTLSAYFTLAQKFAPERSKGLHIDKRYDNFWASILNRSQPLPNNLRILSWNYDSQLEMSYSSFTMTPLIEAYDELNIKSFHNDLSDLDPGKFSVFKLNGSAKASNKVSKKTHYFSDQLTGKADFNFYHELLNTYSALRDTTMKTTEEAYHTELSFAWEHDLKVNAYYSKLRESVKDTSVLVVIGYSFPFFNRSVDKKIINDFMPKVSKVYFQAPDADNLRERFQAITDRIPIDRLVTRFDKDQYVFPNELDL